MTMTRKLILSSLLFLALMAGLAVAAAKSDAAVRDGAKCPTTMPTNAKWRMAPDACYYVTPYGGTTFLPRACTEVAVAVDGREWKQHWAGTESWFGARDAQDGTAPRIGYDTKYGRSPLAVTNGYFRTARVYCWHS